MVTLACCSAEESPQHHRLALRSQTNSGQRVAFGHFILPAPECESSPTGGRQGRGPAPLQKPIRKSETAAEISSHSQDTPTSSGGWPKLGRVARVVTSSRITVGWLAGHLHNSRLQGRCFEEKTVPEKSQTSSSGSPAAQMHVSSL